ncbi:hypothetical protein SLS60_006805 [Paraconiothyrium brasiliense]|uniref:Uncharacterized protein n=1 Tax=Paraconiothyrium brasiliense TaxID=300254 RepID=A0ABR3R7K3_9PLEO
MRFNNSILLLLGLLGLLAFSAPSRSKLGDNGLVKVIDIPRDVDVDLTVRGLALGAADAQDLEKRRGRSGGSRASRRPKKTKTRRPKKTKTKKKPKKTTKKKPTKKKPTKKPKTTKPKKPTTTKPKRPTKSAKPKCKPAKPCKGKNCKRVQPAAGASCELQKKKEPTVNYKTALAAAKRAGVNHLSVGQSYLLVHRDSRTPVTHKVLVMGTVKEIKGQLDFVATGIDLQWDTDVKNDLLAQCTQLYGARCEHHKIEPYKCEYSIAKHKHGSYKFAGTAKPEFADPKTFHSTAADIIEKQKTYSYFYNNCKKHVGRVQNVVAMPKNEDPAYPDEWENF